MIVVCTGTAPVEAEGTASAAHRFSRLIVGHLVERVPASEVAVVVDAPGWEWGTAAPGADARVRDLAELGVEVRPGDTGSGTFLLTEAFAGADRVLLHPGRFGPASELDRYGPMEDGYRWIEAATAVLAHEHAAAGAGRVVYSGTKGSSHRTNDSLLRKVGEDTGVAWTMLHHGLPSEALLPAVELALAGGDLISGLGDALVAPVAETDCARAAAVVLTGEGHAGQTYEVTGVPALKPAGIAALVSRIAGRDVPLRELSPPELRAELRRAFRRATGLDDAEQRADALYRLYALAQSGMWSTTTPTLTELVGPGTLTVEAALRAGLDQAGTDPALASYPFPASAGAWSPSLPPGW